MTVLTLASRTPAPGTMLGLAARDCRRAQKRERSLTPHHVSARKYARYALTVVALMIGLSGFSLSSAQAFPTPWGDMKDNITATIVNVCGPNDVPDQTTFTGIDTIAGLNHSKLTEGYRRTILPDFSEGGTQGGDGMARLQRVYGKYGDVIAKPTYQRYGFSTLQWNQYGYSCFSPTLMMGPLANMSLTAMVHVPMMISMAVLNFAMDTDLYTAFAEMIQPFIGAMYALFEPWIFFVVPLGVFITWVMAAGSLQATMKAAGWGVMILSIFLLMGSSTSQVVTWATNIVTEVSGTAACKMQAASTGKLDPDVNSPHPRTPVLPGDPGDGSSSCTNDDPLKAVQQALWFGIPYQTWHLGQVGEHQAALDEKALKDKRVGWGPAILNGQYVGVTKSGKIDKQGRELLAATSAWNNATYSPSQGKADLWGEGDNNFWARIPYLANVKIMCNDMDGFGNDPDEEEGGADTRWMYNGYGGTDRCDPEGANTSSMIPYIKGNAYNQQFLVALSGMVGAGAVGITVVAAALYLGFQKMMFFFLLFLAPLVLLVSAIGDRKRRPFAIRYAEIIGANLLKQVAAVCIVLFVSYSMASLFGSTTFASIPWIMKPMAAFLFFLALVFLAFPLKNMVKGAIQGDTSVLDKQATAPQRAAKTAGKAAVMVGGVAATGGVAAALGAGGAGAGALAGAGGKGAMMGKAGSMLGQAGRVMGVGSKSGRAMRAGGQLLRAGERVMEARNTEQGRRTAISAAADGILRDPKRSAKYRDDEGQLLPNAQKTAMKDAQKIAEKGRQSDRATQAQNAFMRDYFAGYQAVHGEHHPDDPSNPENMRRAREQQERERRQAREDAGRGDAIAGRETGLAYGPRSGPDDGPDGSSGSPGPDDRPPSGGGPRGGPHSGPSGGPGVSHGRTASMNYEQYAQKARENLSGPAFAREMEYSVNTVRSGDDVLTQAGLTKSQVVQDPTTLLSGEAYNGGSTAAMDPFHPASAPLNELRFASSSRDEDAIQGAVTRAADAIHEHGVPDQIDGVSSIGDRASSFEAVHLVGAMPQLSQDSTWQERADAAHTMMAAQVAMPEDFAARQSVQDYTAALANPGVDVAALASMKESTIADIASTMPRSAGPSAPEHHEPPATTVPNQDQPASAPASQVTSHEGSPAPGGMTREDMRDAVADGLREARLEHDAADTGGFMAGTGTGPTPPADDASAHSESVGGGHPTESTAGPAPTPSVPSEPHSGGVRFAPRDRSGDEPAPDDSMETVEEPEALVYRPERRRKPRRSGFFDDPEDDDNESGQ